MAVNFSCLGLDSLAEDEAILKKCVLDIINTGNEYKGYTGNSYYIKNYGSTEFVVRTENEYDDGTKKLAILGVDTHTQGRCDWDVRISELDVTPEDADVLEKRVLVHHVDKGAGLAAVNLVNADVLPSFMPGDVLQRLLSIMLRQKILR